MSGNWAYTALGWSVVIGASGIAWLYYKGTDKTRRPIRGRTVRAQSTASNSSAAAATAAEPSEARPVKAGRRRNIPHHADGNASSESAVTAAASRSSTRNQKMGGTAGATEFLPLVPDDRDDLAFAQELRNRQQGTNLSQPKRQQSTRQKSVRQSNANKRAAEMEVSTASSTTGAEADDDLSSVPTPELEAEPDEQMPDGLDPSDMLEPAVPGPSVLRLTDTDKAERKKPAPPKPQQEAETKRQRQNRRKAEERRLQKEADEKARRSQLENQRRTAREARGEPAKNGIPVAPPATNAWNTATATSVAQDPPAFQPQAPNGNSGSFALLDTFNSTGTDGGSTASSNVGSSSQDVHWEKDLPSEEEQMRRLMEEDESAWTVAKGKKNRRKNAEQDAVGGVKTESLDSPITA